MSHSYNAGTSGATIICNPDLSGPIRFVGAEFAGMPTQVIIDRDLLIELLRGVPDDDYIELLSDVKRCKDCGADESEHRCHCMNDE